MPDDPTRNNGDSLQPPFYLTLQMPDTDTTSFSLTSTFIRPAEPGACSPASWR